MTNVTSPGDSKLCVAGGRYVRFTKSKLETEKRETGKKQTKARKVQLRGVVIFADCQTASLVASFGDGAGRPAACLAGLLLR